MDIRNDRRSGIKYKLLPKFPLATTKTMQQRHFDLTIGDIFVHLVNSVINSVKCR